MILRLLRRDNCSRCETYYDLLLPIAGDFKADGLKGGGHARKTMFDLRREGKRDL